MPRNAKPRRRWLPWELEFLRRCYADYWTVAIAKVLGCSQQRVLAKANEMGLKKSPAVLSQVAAFRTEDPAHGGRATRFKPGQVPANKGLRRPGWASGRMRETQFKPGRKPHTWVPVGSYRVVEGVLERKFSDDPGPPNVRWAPVHKLLWQEAHGPIPAGCVVTFRPGCHTTHLARITLAVIECIPRAELMARNTIHNLPEKLKSVITLRAQLTRQINKRVKES